MNIIAKIKVLDGIDKEDWRGIMTYKKCNDVQYFSSFVEIITLIFFFLINQEFVGH
jgi:hypothetical protein